MSTRASLVYPKEGEGSWGFYLELLDDTVHFEINTAGVSIDIELMPISQWQALGFPNRFAAPNTASTGQERAATAHPDCGDPGCCPDNPGGGVPVRSCR